MRSKGTGAWGIAVVLAVCGCEGTTRGSRGDSADAMVADRVDGGLSDAGAVSVLPRDGGVEWRFEQELERVDAACRWLIPEPPDPAPEYYCLDLELRRPGEPAAKLCIAASLNDCGRCAAAGGYYIEGGNEIVLCPATCDAFVPDPEAQPWLVLQECFPADG